MRVLFDSSRLISADILILYRFCMFMDMWMHLTADLCGTSENLSKVILLPDFLGDSLEGIVLKSHFPFLENSMPVVQ